jgi:hypothetical protein
MRQKLISALDGKGRLSVKIVEDPPLVARDAYSASSAKEMTLHFPTPENLPRQRLESRSLDLTR